MAEGAALLVVHVLPAVGYRQCVLSFEGPLAVRLGYDRALLAKVAERPARAVMQDKRLTSTQIWSSPVVFDRGPNRVGELTWLKDHVERHSRGQPISNSAGWPRRQ